jgi:hypothetical protein
MRHFSISFVVLACLAASACTDQNTTIWITQVPAPSFEEGEGCTSSGVALLSTSWGATGATDYAQLLDIVNSVRSNATDVANDSAWVQIHGIEVTLYDANGNALDLGGPNPYTMPVSGGTIPSAGGAGDLGQSTVSAIIIPAGFAPAVAGLAPGFVIAEIIPFGSTLGGLDVEGPPYNLAIRITGSDCETPICPDQASGVDYCSFGQDGSCPVLPENDPACEG